MTLSQFLRALSLFAALCCGLPMFHMTAYADPVSDVAKDFFKAKTDVNVVEDPTEGSQHQQFKATVKQIAAINAERRAAIEKQQAAIDAGLCESNPPASPDCIIGPSTDYSFNSVVVPKAAAPFQVQLVNTETFAPTSWLKETYPNDAVWELRHVCGGSLIAKNWVLTAAHCIKPGLEPEHLSVRLDVENISMSDGKNTPVKRIIIHKDFIADTYDNDIALIEIETSDDVIARVADEYVGVIKHRYISDNKIAVLTADFVVQIVDLKSRKIKETFKLPQGEGSPFGVQLLEHAVLHKENRVYVLRDYGKLHDARRLDITDMETLYVDYVEQGDVVLATSGYAAKIWNAKRKRDPKSVIFSGDYKDSFDISSDRALVLLGLATDPYAKSELWDLKDAKHITALDVEGYVNEVESFADGKYFVAFSDTKNRVFDSRDGQHIFDVPFRRNGENFGYLSKGDVIFYVTRDGALKYRTARSMDRESSLQTHLKIKNLSYHESSDRVVFWDNSANVEIWDLKSRTRVAAFNGKFDAFDTSVELFDKGRKMLIWTVEGRSQIWTVGSSEPDFVFEHSLPVASVQISESEDYVITRGTLDTAEVWNIKTGQPLMRVYHGVDLDEVKLLNRDKTLLTRNRNDHIKLWDLKTGAEIMRIYGDEHTGGPDTFGNEPIHVETIDVSYSDDDLESYRDVVSYGWGKIKQVRGFEPSAMLRTLSLKVLPKDECIQQTGWGAHVIGETEFCGFDKNRKTCYGDSGGPVISQDQKLVGIVSWGNGKCNADKYPGVYTKVHKFYPWIKGYVCQGEALTTERLCEY